MTDIEVESIPTNPLEQNPTLEDANRPWSDRELKSKGLLFAANYLLIRAYQQTGYRINAQIPLAEIQGKFAALYPYHPAYIVNQIGWDRLQKIAFNKALEWVIRTVRNEQGERMLTEKTLLADETKDYDTARESAHAETEVLALASDFEAELTPVNTAQSPSMKRV
jgi:hypothetical protein